MPTLPSFSILKYLPLAIGIAILSIGAFFVPWHDVMPYFSRLSPISFAAIFGLGIAYYAARIIRYYYMLGVLDAPQSFIRTVTAYFVAQPIALLPAGEAYRVVTLKEHANVSKQKGLSVVFIQAFTENIAMVLLALVSALVLNQYVFIIVGLLLLYLVILVAVRTKRTVEHSHRFISKIPFVNFARSKFHSFVHKNQTLLGGGSLIVLFISGFGTALIASSLLFIVANDIGVHIDFTQAVIAFVLPTVLQNVSFLPAGIGVNEQGSVGILVLLGAPLPAAVFLTLTMRFVTLILGVIIGLVSIGITKLR